MGHLLYHLSGSGGYDPKAEKEEDEYGHPTEPLATRHVARMLEQKGRPPPDFFPPRQSSRTDEHPSPQSVAGASGTAQIGQPQMESGKPVCLCSK